MGDLRLAVGILWTSTNSFANTSMMAKQLQKLFSGVARIRGAALTMLRNKLARPARPLPDRFQA